MADKKISDLGNGAPAQHTDLIPIARAGANVYLTVSDLAAEIGAPYLPLAGGTLTGNVAVDSGHTIDGVDISVLKSDYDAHTHPYLPLAGGNIGGASHYATFDATGHLTFTGNARPWRDELGDAIALQQQGSGVSRNATEISVEFTTGANLSDFLYTNVQMNHDKDLGASISPHIHFWQAENKTPNFLFNYRWQKNGGAKVTSWIYLPCNLLAFPYVSGTLNQIAYSAPIVAPVGVTVSDVLQFKIYRDNANTSGAFVGGADQYTATVGITNFDVHFMINSLGSTDEYAK